MHVLKQVLLSPVQSEGDFLPGLILDGIEITQPPGPVGQVLLKNVEVHSLTLPKDRGEGSGGKS